MGVKQAAGGRPMKKRRKPPAPDAGSKARRRARLAIGSIPPARIIEPKKFKRPKHKGRPEETGSEESEDSST